MRAALSRVFVVAAREWREQLRQPGMIAVIVSLFAAISGLVLAALVLLDRIATSAAAMEQFRAFLPAIGLDAEATLEAVVGIVVGLDNWLLFTQYMGVSAVIAGHAVLHDRQTGALPFLLLAPVRRGELLVGKVLGAIGPSTALYVGINGITGLVAASLPVTAPYADRMATAPAWWVALLVGGPVWAAFVSTACAIVSSVARDVRTAQQGVWFVMFFMTFAAGYGLAGRLGDGVLVQAVVAGVGVVACAVAVEVGRAVISRDLGR